MFRAVSVLLTAGVFLACAPAWAHHSFAASYDEGKTITIEGDIANYDYRNPHAWVTLNVPDDKGNLIFWSAEWRGAGRLSREGIDKDTLRPGDHVIIRGAPGKTASDHKIHLKYIERPADGFRNEMTGRYFQTSRH